MLPGELLEARYIASGAMMPTLHVNDRVIVNKLYSAPQRGDIVIFYPPESAVPLNQQQPNLFIKRVIGLPGDTLEVTNGQVIVNSEPLAEDYIKGPITYQWGPETIPDDQ